jgi:exosome complex exonuclease RRP6
LSRPLPEEYLRYAREDTHYLLYIYDRLRNQLLDAKEQDSELLRTIYVKSKIICQKVMKDTHVNMFSGFIRICFLPGTSIYSLL